jgi:hypothetical protein
VHIVTKFLQVYLNFQLDEPAAAADINQELQGGISHRYTSDPRFNLYFWGNKIHVVPEDFTFPVLSCKAMWDLCFFCDESKRIGPYMKIIKSDLKINEQSLLAKARGVMKVIFDLASALNAAPNISYESMYRKNRITGSAIFEAGYLHLLELIYLSSNENNLQQRRVEELQYTTIYQ